MSLKWIVSLPIPPDTPDSARTVSTLGWGAFEEECLREAEAKDKRRQKRREKLTPIDEDFRRETARRKREYRRAQKAKP